ncbi:hypothetical protein CEXT_372021 [Caerostris extrusa]|uniref:Uncharacterized protein n=1 Tax=Caerostris extrusa TaxID=172846 RepID=A0AAV4PFS5_CAEEX|nr:hypothetical protein CEXT_372021 [Caerostris extrusa]
MNAKRHVCPHLFNLQFFHHEIPSQTLTSNRPSCQPHTRFLCHVPPAYISFRCRLMSFFPLFFLCSFCPYFPPGPTDAREKRNGSTRCDVTTTGCQGLFDTEIQIQSIS